MRCLALVLALCLAAAPVAAQGPIRRLELDGAAGYWFPAPAARLALEAQTLRPQLEDRIRLLEERLQLETRALVISRDALGRSEEQRAALGRQLEREHRQQRRLRNPILWFVVGLVAGGAVVGMLARSAR